MAFASRPGRRTQVGQLVSVVLQPASRGEALVSSPRYDLVLGCIADDFTGATDLGNTLTREGMSVIQTIGVPPPQWRIPRCDALVISLKTRTAPIVEAVEASLVAARFLKRRRARRYFFKYCSTFDSRVDGNIGPVADALLDELDVPLTIVCPAFPEAGRTVYRGNLFVGDALLDESAMSRHPLTPMTDSNLVRVLGRQTGRPVVLVPYDVVNAGPPSIARALAVAQDQGARYAVIDALDDAHLRWIGQAVKGDRLVTGASGVARGLPGAYRDDGMLPKRAVAVGPAVPVGPMAVLAGSASPATVEQVAVFAEKAAHVAVVDPFELAANPDSIEEAVRAAVRRLASGPVLVHSTNGPEDVRRAQAQLGVERSAALVEAAMARFAAALVAAGARRLVVAGGETSAAVVQGLRVRALRIGPEIAPGVPWCTSITAPRIGLALKSGNFGSRDFFADAIAALS